MRSPIRSAPLLLGLPVFLIGFALAPGGFQDPKPAQDEKGSPTPEEIEAELQRQIEERLTREREAHFRICDGNRNGWISFREAAYALNIERDEFRKYDKDEDGRIDWKEFEERYVKVLAQVGGHPVLRAELQEMVTVDDLPSLTPLDPSEIVITFPTAADLLAIYDQNRDESLDDTELELMFVSLLVELTARDVIAQLDTNLTRTLEMEELGTLAEMVTESFPGGTPGEGKLEPKDVYSRLYAANHPRRSVHDTPSLPPLIPGPVTHFRRLDLDDDGFIDGDDLRELTTPSRVDVRASAILAALDTDGDDRLTEAEFLRSVGATPDRER